VDRKNPYYILSFLEKIAIKRTVLTLFLFTVCSSLNAQNFKKIKPYAWMLGVHWNVMDDTGNRYDDIFDVKNGWNALPYPSTLNFDLYFLEGVSAEIIGGFNQYKSAKTINDTTGLAGNVTMIDVHAKYSFGFLMNQQIIDPFAVLGVGYTGRPMLDGLESQLNANIGFGVNIMIYQGLGVQWRTTGKIGVTPEFYTTDADYLHHQFGLIYKFPEIGKNNAGASKAQHSWTKKKYRYRKPRGM
jgi:hypothetical protein